MLHVQPITENAASQQHRASLYPTFHNSKTLFPLCSDPQTETAFPVVPARLTLHISMCTRRSSHSYSSLYTVRTDGSEKTRVFARGCRAGNRVWLRGFPLIHAGQHGGTSGTGTHIAGNCNKPNSCLLVPNLFFLGTVPNTTTSIVY